MSTERGYVMGPILEQHEEPWPLFWERTPDTCDHIWELVLLKRGKRRGRMEEVVRCMVCHAPRCGHSIDNDPCMERRHHRSPHRYLSGRTEKVGA